LVAICSIEYHTADYSREKQLLGKQDLHKLKQSSCHTQNKDEENTPISHLLKVRTMLANAELSCPIQNIK
jgi:hypothetical protein